MSLDILVLVVYMIFNFFCPFIVTKYSIGSVKYLCSMRVQIDLMSMNVLYVLACLGGITDRVSEICMGLQGFESWHFTHILYCIYISLISHEELVWREINK